MHDEKTEFWHIGNNDVRHIIFGVEHFLPMLSIVHIVEEDLLHPTVND